MGFGRTTIMLGESVCPSLGVVWGQMQGFDPGLPESLLRVELAVSSLKK